LTIRTATSRIGVSVETAMYDRAIDSSSLGQRAWVSPSSSGNADHPPAAVAIDLDVVFVQRRLRAVTPRRRRRRPRYSGNLDLTSVLGTGSTAFAGGTGSTVLGSGDVALVFGTGSTADAGASLTTAGNGDLAVVFGNMLGAAATGVDQGVAIVTAIFSAML
jgi:hypothetical protein